MQTFAVIDNPTGLQAITDFAIVNSIIIKDVIDNFGNDGLQPEASQFTSGIVLTSFEHATAVAGALSDLSKPAVFDKWGSSFVVFSPLSPSVTCHGKIETLLKSQLAEIELNRIAWFDYLDTRKHCSHSEAVAQLKMQFLMH